MKTRKWFLRIAGGFVAFVILLALASAVLVSTRQGRMKPLDREELARLGIAVPDKNVSADLSVEPGTASRSGSTKGKSADPLRPADPVTASEDTSATLDSPAEAKRMGPPRLAHAATAADARLAFNGPERTLPLRIDVVAESAGFKCAESVLWLVGSDTRKFATWVALTSVWLGDRATARDYLEEMLRDSDSGPYRESTCAMLAWVEDDPEVATSLLECSCTNGEARFLYNAMSLAVSTDSDELAESYFQRWSAAVGAHVTGRWLAGSWQYGPSSPKLDAWKKRHVTKSD